MQHDRREALEAATGVVEHTVNHMRTFNPLSLLINEFIRLVFVQPNSSSKLFPSLFFC